MENEKETDAIKDYISKIVRPIFDEALKETPKNPMSAGSVREKKDQYCIYQPHNLRLYFDFNKESLDIEALKKPTLINQKVGSVVPTYKVRNSREHELKDYYGCRIIVKKVQIEIQPNYNADKKYIIDYNKDTDAQFQKIHKEKINESRAILQLFMKEFGGLSNFNLKNLYCHPKIFHEKIIDKLPFKMRWDDAICQKVYNENNVEFKNPLYAQRYIKEQVLESKAPQIQEELKIIKETVKGVLEVNASTSKVINEFVGGFLEEFMPVHKEHAKNIKTHTAVLKKIDKGFRKFNKLLEQKTLNEYK